MKKLRLLVTDICNRSCSGCCNKQFDLVNLPIVHREELKDYSEIMLTGGEPLLYPRNLLRLIDNIKSEYKGLIYLYTASVNIFVHPTIMRSIDGFQLSLHDNMTIEEAQNFNNWQQMGLKHAVESGCTSNRLHFFPGIKHVLNIEGQYWTSIKLCDWIPDCPLPWDEEFKRIKNFLT